MSEYTLCFLLLPHIKCLDMYYWLNCPAVFLQQMPTEENASHFYIHQTDTLFFLNWLTNSG